ncbi:MAG TPA: hypothetical protein VHA13_01225 [Gammaproteobacteria bacterium]|nr:hypothetical protein [Gammaproteobacteria bacterium]
MAHSCKTKLYLFDFDLTLTREGTDDFDYDMTDEEIKANIMEHLGECFKAILNAENKLGIVSRNPEPDLIKQHLLAAGLTIAELAKISIRCPKLCKSGNKTTWVVEFISENEGIDEINYYDDDEDFLSQAKIEFDKHAWTAKSLNTFNIPLEAEYSEHFLEIITQLKGNAYPGKLFAQVGSSNEMKEINLANKGRESLSETTTDSFPVFVLSEAAIPLLPLYSIKGQVLT